MEHLVIIIDKNNKIEPKKYSCLITEKTKDESIKNAKKIMKTSIKILSIILITLLISCQETKKQVYKTKDGKGYCYQDDDTLLWYLLIYNNSTHSYDVTPTSATPSYDITTSESMSVDSNSMSADMSESTGQDVGGTDANNESSGEGMSESSGSDSGGGDSSGGDSGGSDGGGGGE